MDSVTKDDACAALKLLADAAATREEELEQYPSQFSSDSEQEEDSQNPIIDNFFAEGVAAGIMQMANFSLAELSGIWKLIEPHVSASWNIGRGRKSSFHPKDVLFMTLTLLKHGGNWDFSAKMFKIKGPTFERLVMNFVESVHQFLYQEIVEKWENKFTMTRLLQDKTTFKHHRHALYASDVTFQQSNRPTGNHQESKGYFSNKHKLYGFKTEVSVLPNGLAINATKHHPGSVADIEILKQNLLFHRSALKKVSEIEENEIQDMGPLAEEYSGRWALLLDKVYQGAAQFLRAVSPKKKPRNGVLTADEDRQNKRVASDRIIVENYFGRLCTLWNVMGNKYRWSEKSYDSLFRICMALTNMHIKWHPLRDEDGRAFGRYKSRLNKIGIQTAQKRKNSQAQYRARRKARLALTFSAQHQHEEGGHAMLDLLDE